MKKIPTIFKRNPERMQEVLPEINESCQWVFDGEGVATRKYDGMCCMIKDGALFKRREVKKGKQAPDNFVLADHDEITGKCVGWVPVDSESKEDQYFMEAMDNLLFLSDMKLSFLSGTYELVGPKVQGNAENYREHSLLRHELAEQYTGVPLAFSDLKEWISHYDIEGLVFHHPDGRMAKIKKRDFGLNR